MTAREHAEHADRILSETIDAVRGSVEPGKASPWDTAQAATQLESAYRAAVPHALTAIALALTGGALDDGRGVLHVRLDEL